MYVTAHHVRTAMGTAGINVFLHVHGGLMPQGTFDPAFVSRIADEFPGVLVTQNVDLPPGGNFVDSYLDVVAADGTAATAIRSALDAFESTLDAPLPTFGIFDGPVGIRFSANIGLWPTMREELHRLREPLEALVAVWHAAGAPVSPMGRTS